MTLTAHFFLALKFEDWRFSSRRRRRYVAECSTNSLPVFIYNLTNDCTFISNAIITNNMLLHVSTFKMSSSGSSFRLAKITYRFSGRPENMYVILARHRWLRNGVKNSVDLL